LFSRNGEATQGAATEHVQQSPAGDRGPETRAPGGALQTHCELPPFYIQLC